MRVREAGSEVGVRSRPGRGGHPRLGPVLATWFLLGVAFLGCSAGPEWTAVPASPRASRWRPLDGDPASMAALGRDTVEKLGYARILELARAAGFVARKKVPSAVGGGGAMLGINSTQVVAAAEVFAEVFSEYAVAAGVTSQLDSPLPGPADIVALGILICGVYEAGVMTAEDLAKAKPKPVTTAPPAASATTAPSATAVPTVTAPPLRAPKTCGTEYPDRQICASLPAEYTFSSEGAALAKMKAKYRDKGLILHNPDRTRSGPCPGDGEHFNVRQGKDRAGSITCCPCCVDGPPTPREEKRCRIVP